MLSTRTLQGGVATSAAAALGSILLLAVTDLTPLLHPTAHWSAAPTAEAPRLERLYVPIETADGTVTSLAATNGRVRVATLFYTHCPGACPATIAGIRALERQISGSERARLGVLLLSLDPVRDSPAMLAEMRAQQATDSRWLLGRTAPELLPGLVAAFDVRVTRAPEGINHTPAVVLLDAKGVVIARTEDVSGLNPRFLRAVRSALDAPGS